MCPSDLLPFFNLLLWGIKILYKTSPEWIPSPGLLEPCLALACSADASSFHSSTEREDHSRLHALLRKQDKSLAQTCDLFIQLCQAGLYQGIAVLETA